MKKNKLISLFLLTISLIFVVGCNEISLNLPTLENNTEATVDGTTTNGTISNSDISTTEEATTTESTTTTESITTTEENTGIDFSESENTKSGVKKCAKKQTQELYEENIGIDESLEVIFNEVMDKIENADGSIEELKTLLNSYYKEFKDAIELFKETYNDVITYIEHQKEVLLSVHTSLLNLVNDANKYYLNNLYSELIAKLDSLTQSTNLSDVESQVETMINEYKEVAVNYSKTIASDLIATYINQAVYNLDYIYQMSYFYPMDEENREELNSLYTECKEKITSCIKIENVNEYITETVQTFKIDLYPFVHGIISYSVDELKSVCLNIITNQLNHYLELIDDESFITEITSFVEQKKTNLATLTSTDELENFLDTVQRDIINYAKTLIGIYINEHRPALFAELDNTVNEGLSKIDDEEIKATLQQYLSDKKAYIVNITTYEEFTGVCESAVADVTSYINELLEEEIKALITKTQNEIDTGINALLNKIDDQSLKTELNGYYTELKEDLDNAKSADDVKTALKSIGTKLETYTSTILGEYLEILKTKTTTQIDTLKETISSKLNTEALKTELSTYITGVKTSINAVTVDQDFEAGFKTIIENATLEGKKLVAKMLEPTREIMITLLAEMNTGSNFTNIDELIPESMKSSYSANTVAASQVTYDFTSSVNISDIIFGGFGKGWHRVSANIDTVNYFISIMDNASPYITSSISLLNTYLESEYADSLSYEEESEEGFKVSISYNEEAKTLSYSIEFVSQTLKSIPGVSITYDNDTKKKEVEINVNDSTKMKYAVTSNSYEFVATLSSLYYYMKVEKDDITKGTIYLSAPIFGGYTEFYIDDDYVVVACDKGEGTYTSKSYNVEVYNKETGKLIGFENKGVDATTNDRIWLHLSDISGITSIRVDEDDNIYLNGSDTKFITKDGLLYYYYNIKFVTEYFYEWSNEEQKLIEHEILIPMIYIREDNLDDFSTYFNEKNSISVSISLDEAYLNKIMSEYDSKIESIADNKESITEENVKAFLGIE